MLAQGRANERHCSLVYDLASKICEFCVCGSSQARIESVIFFFNRNYDETCTDLFLLPLFPKQYILAATNSLRYRNREAWWSMPVISAIGSLRWEDKNYSVNVILEGFLRPLVPK